MAVCIFSISFIGVKADTIYELVYNLHVNSGYGYIYNGNVIATGNSSEVGVYIGSATSNNGAIAKAIHGTGVDKSANGSPAINGVTGEVICNPKTQSCWSVDSEDYGSGGKAILYHGGSLNGAFIGLNLGDSKFTDSAIVLRSQPGDISSGKIRWQDGTYIYDDSNSGIHFGNGYIGETMKIDKLGHVYINSLGNCYLVNVGGIIKCQSP